MALTDEQRQQFWSQYNTPTQPRISDRVQGFRNAAGIPQQPLQPQPDRESALSKGARLKEDNGSAKSGFFQNLFKAGKERFGEVQEATQRGLKGEQTQIETLTQSGTAVARFGGDALFESAKGLLNLITTGVTSTLGATSRLVGGEETGESIKEDIKTGISETAQLMFDTNPLLRKGLEALGQGIEKFEEFEIENPRAAANLKSVVTLGDILLGGFGAKKLIKKTGEEVVELTARQNKIADIISPQINAKETRKIVAEGRATRGKKKLFGKLPDTVEQADEVKRSAQTIDRRIQGSGNMDDLTLNDNIKTEIGNIPFLI